MITNQPVLGGRTMITNQPVVVYYWRGTELRHEFAADYAEAMDIASLNINARSPTFFDAATGEKLHDDGNGLATEDGVYVV